MCIKEVLRLRHVGLDTLDDQSKPKSSRFVGGYKSGCTTRFVNNVFISSKGFVLEGRAPLVHRPLPIGGGGRALPSLL